MGLKIPIEAALERAREVQPSDHELIELRNLPDGQWLACYLKENSQVEGHKRMCYSMLECPLFDEVER